MTTIADPIVTLHGEAEFQARAGHLFAPRSEFICAATDLSTWVNQDSRSSVAKRLAMHRRLADGVVMRKMYNPGVLDDPASARHLRDLVEHGMPVRICPTELAHETIIIDRKVAILAGPAVAGERDYTIVRSPEVIAGVYSLFNASWQIATELTEHIRRRTPPIGTADREILRLLSSGRKDETAARELGLSVRTYRRRVAELMTLLGADSRFQAGSRARELGLQP